LRDYIGLGHGRFAFGNQMIRLAQFGIGAAGTVDGAIVSKRLHGGGEHRRGFRWRLTHRAYKLAGWVMPVRFRASLS
jgi:hypothetical protein